MFNMMIYKGTKCSIKMLLPFQMFLLFVLMISQGKPLSSLENTYQVQTNKTDLNPDHRSSALYSSHHYQPSHHNDNSSSYSHNSRNTPWVHSHTSLNNATLTPHSHTTNSSGGSHNYSRHSKSFSPTSNMTTQYDYSSRFRQDCFPGESNFTNR